jgi:hypothetical protein
MEFSLNFIHDIWNQKIQKGKNIFSPHLDPFSQSWSHICFTKEECINSSLSRNVDLLLHLNRFKLLIQQKSNEDSFSKLNKLYKNKISKGKKHEKRKQPHEKSSISGKKIKLTKSNTNVEQKNPTQKTIA